MLPLILLLVGVWPGGHMPGPHAVPHTEMRIPPDTMVPNVTNSAPGSWKPFTGASPWNVTIKMEYGDPEPIHPNSAAIIARMAATPRFRLNGTFNPTLWFVPTDENMEYYHVTSSSHIYNAWDQADDRLSDIYVPMNHATMWPELATDHHIAIVCQRPCVHVPNVCGGVWQDLQIIPDSSVIEMSHFAWGTGPPFTPTCSTFNVWDYRNDYTHGYVPGGGSLSDGYQPYPLPNGAHRTERGGRGGGTPCFAGLLRPEEVLAGNSGADSVITHALSFNSTIIRGGPVASPQEMFINPPCVRSDAPGHAIYGEDAPIYGTLIQLAPNISDDSLNVWFNQGSATDKANARRVAHALQTYGAYLVDWGGPNAIFVQNLNSGPNTADSQAQWEARVPNLYHNISQIPTTAFRVIYTGDSTVIAQ